LNQNKRAYGSSHNKEAVMRIGERLGELCARSGLTLQALEDAAGLQAGYLSRVIEGREIPSCDILGRLAVALEMPLTHLFREEGEVVRSSKLTPRPTIEQLAEDRSRRQPLGILGVIAAAWKLGRLGPS
jgi:transcriptional regulator with XRE-family HTH domain